MIDTWHAHASFARIMHRYQTYLLLLKPRVYPRFLVLLHFLAVPELFWNTTLYLVALFPSSPLGYKSFSEFSPFIFSNPDNFENNWLFWAMFLFLFFDVFLMIRLGLWVLERKISEVTRTSSHHTKHTFIPTDTNSEVGVSRMGDTVWPYSSPEGGGMSLCPTHCWGMGLTLFPLKGRVSVIIWNSVKEHDLSFAFIYLSINLIIYFANLGS